MNKLLKAAGLFAIVLIIGLLIFYITPSGRGAINNYLFKVQKVDDVTNYDTIKNVEDTCRAMISSYETDKLTYLQYKDSANEEKQSWAEQAKMRANKTANSYNNYILKNSFIWVDNIPEDIDIELKLIE
jgi:hypothetical protein